MQDYRISIDLETQTKIINKALSQGNEIEQFEGVLNDTFIIYNAENIGLTVNSRKVKPRKFIICGCAQTNEWSNTLYIELTDNASKVDQFIKSQIVNIKA